MADPTASAPRAVAIQNRHPRLRVPMREVRRAIAVLDAHFRPVTADLPALAPARRRTLTALLRTAHAPSAASVCPPGELSLVFLTDAALARLHADFMDDPTPTDVITFEGEAMAGLAGEICVSADTAARFVGLRRGSARQAQFAAELTLYVVHGWLHLAGYDDLRPDRKRRMRAAERRALTLLHKHAAMPAFRLR